VNQRILSLLLGAALAASNAAYADPIACVPGVPHPQSIDFADVTLNGVQANGCFGVVTGDPTATNLGVSEPLSLLVGPALPNGVPVSGSLQDIAFTLTVTSDNSFFNNEGAWTLGWSASGASATIDLVAVVDSGGSFASYFFDNVALSAAGGQFDAKSTPNWVVSFLNLEGSSSLSSFSLFAGDFQSSALPPPVPTPVDEPATGGLLALASLGLVIARRRPARR